MCLLNPNKEEIDQPISRNRHELNMTPTTQCKVRKLLNLYPAIKVLNKVAPPPASCTDEDTDRMKNTIQSRSQFLRWLDTSAHTNIFLRKWKYQRVNKRDQSSLNVRVATGLDRPCASAVSLLGTTDHMETARLSIAARDINPI